MYQTIVVFDNEGLIPVGEHLFAISFDHYLADYPMRNEPRTRIINLCDTEHYLSRGYYCSLLAEARQHKVLPSVSTINDLRDFSSSGFADLTMSLPSQLVAFKTLEQPLELLVYFGWVDAPEWKKLARQIYEKYPAPILSLLVGRDGSGLNIQVRRYAFAGLDTVQREQFMARLECFTASVWRSPAKLKRQRWDMAILVDPDEKNPPSDKYAIKHFVKAALKHGINAEIITTRQGSNIAQYDALFIRQTTAIDHPSYRLARRAEREGLVVIDDPTSILRCCNKVFLHDAFSYNRVPSPKTRVAIDSTDPALDDVEAQFDYPLVLKMPEGSFSKGVYRIHDRAELQSKLQELLHDTALVLVQEYLYTDFDWRIGVLAGRAIYACRYHMARNHWQIYNHQAKQRDVSGGFETLPTFEVPGAVLDAAIKACAIVGHGLYGVDIKQKDKHVYVIEVNDNPNIDHKVEDAYLGKELYMTIMAEFARRLEQRGR